MPIMTNAVITGRLMKSAVRFMDGLAEALLVILGRSGYRNRYASHRRFHHNWDRRRRGRGDPCQMDAQVSGEREKREREADAREAVFLDDRAEGPRDHRLH